MKNLQTPHLPSPKPQNCTNDHRTPLSTTPYYHIKPSQTHHLHLRHQHSTTVIEHPPPPIRTSNNQFTDSKSRIPKITLS
ncbi:hypothetical protein Hanom_Chr03g00178481 [Helianthus anomalus]